MTMQSYCNHLDTPCLAKKTPRVPGKDGWCWVWGSRDDLEGCNKLWLNCFTLSSSYNTSVQPGGLGSPLFRTSHVFRFPLKVKVRGAQHWSEDTLDFAGWI